MRKLLYAMQAVAMLLLLNNMATAQGILKGKITSESGEPLGNASIVVGGNKGGTATDSTGTYRLSLPSGTYKVVITSVGFNPYSMTVKIDNTTVTRDVALQFAIADLSEVVVAVGSRASQRTFTTTPLPVDNINASELQSAGQLSFDKALQLRVPSFNTVNTPVNDATSLLDPYEIRNMGPSRTLILVNGKRKNPSALVYIQTSPGRGETGADLSAIPTEAIKRVEILRDGASAQYGSDAIAGVMNVILKDRFDYTNFKIASGVTHKGDGFSILTSLNGGANIGSKGFINYTINFQRENKTNRSGTVDAEGDNNDLSDGTAASLVEVKKYLARFPDAKNISGTPTSTAAKFLINAGIPVSENTDFYANAAYVYKKVQSFANYRTPYWKQDYGLLHAAGTEYLGYGPTFEGDLNDYNATVGFKTIKSGWTHDISFTTGGNKQLYTVENTVNHSLGAKSPIRFKPGGFAFNHVVGNIDISKEVTDKLNVAFGSEFRSENFQIFAGDTASYTGEGANSFPGVNEINAIKVNRFNIGGYFDLSYDITKALLVNGTVRQEYYSDFGSAFVWKISGRAKVAGDKLTIRSSVSTGFRAPSLHQINLQIAQQSFVPGQGIQTKGIVSNKSPQAHLLGVPALKPEKSVNFTAGFGFNPTKNLSVTVDYYHIDIKDRIILSSNITNTAAGNTELDDVLRNNGIVGVSFFTNGIHTKTEGIDVVANYKNIPVGNVGKLTINLAGNYTLANELTGNVTNPKLISDAGQSTIDDIQIALLTTSRPKYKAVLGGDLVLGKWDFLLNNTLFGPTTFHNDGLDKNLKLEFQTKVLTDLNIGYQFSSRVNASIAVNNIFNITPEWKLKALNSNGDAILSDPAKVKQNVNAITFNGRYSMVTYDGSHFSQLGTTFLATLNFKL
ncbi:ferric enterobactin receptor [Niastella koreensis]|uniref:TonB-dependent receptor plug n=2 Tax=Niastella koreensis TaxID=354356 RepID=G8TKQ9_NIAKG|nr:TonB-dependent receptor [Niastella koreensis]AEV99738.1 TonB-dependent receptor plug [Niastella koreensis GR20-10]OQP51638.1 ferric enterobactin receptor [Niastella koreensis]